VLAIAMSVLAAPVVAVPVTLVVDDDGMASAADCGAADAAYTTIQGAVDAAVSGDTVMVCPGVYDEQVVIDGLDLTLQGAGNSTIIRPSSAAVLTDLYTYPAGTFWPGTVMASVILVEDSDAVTIKNLKVDGIDVTTLPAGAARVAGILYGESGGTVNSATVTTMVVDGYTTRTYGIDLSATGTSRTVEVKNSLISDWSRNGIQAQGGSLNADLHDNTLVGPGDPLNASAVPNGILFIHDVDGNATSNVIHGMHTSVTTSRSAGILIYDPVTPGIVLDDNDIYDTDDGIIVGHNANDVLIFQNNLHDNLEVGIHLEDGATDTTITANTISDNVLVGIRFAGAADPTTPDTPPGAGNVAHRNLIAGNGVGVANYDTQTFDAERNWWGDPSGPSGEGFGDGDPVTTNVTYESWCFNAACSKLAFGGTDGPDILSGTASSDIIFGFDGDDEIDGLDGDDRIYAGVGADTVYGGDGADRIYGFSGDDTIYGNVGRDSLYGNGGADFLHGGKNADFCSGGKGADTLMSC
jgi:parallel beta-helix repeat protein